MILELYEKHEWIQAEATYSGSSSYIEERQDEEGAVTEVVRDSWCYDYEVNGQVRSAFLSGRKKEIPDKKEQERMIMVAKDDNSIYMMYESDKQMKKI